MNENLKEKKNHNERGKDDAENRYQLMNPDEYKKKTTEVRK